MDLGTRQRKGQPKFSSSPAAEEEEEEEEFEDLDGADDESALTTQQVNVTMRQLDEQASGTSAVKLHRKDVTGSWLVYH